MNGDPVVRDDSAPAPKRTTSATEGQWPSPWRQFWYDLLPKNSSRVPNQSGLVAPAIDTSWITTGRAEHPEALEQARRAHDMQRDRADAIEQKSNRMATLCLTLLGVSLALGGFQVHYARTHGALWSILLVPVAASVAFLTLATVAALEVDRVGLYTHTGGEALAGNDQLADATADLIRAEEYGRRLAEWTASKKADQLLQARPGQGMALACCRHTPDLGIAGHHHGGVAGTYASIEDARLIHKFNVPGRSQLRCSWPPDMQIV